MKDSEKVEMTPIIVLDVKATGNNCCDDSQGECDFDY